MPDVFTATRIGLSAVLAAISLLACSDGSRPEDPPLPATATRPMPTTAPTPEPTVTPTPVPTSTPAPTAKPGKSPAHAPQATPTPVAEASPADVYAGVSPSIAYIRTTRGQAGGVLIEPGYIVTNYHVVWPDEAVRVVFPDGKELESVPVIGWDPMADLAVLGPVNTSAQPLRLEAGESTPIGGELFLIGYPAEVDRFPEPTITGGVLSRLREWEKPGITYFQTDSAVAGGQSGGALVNTRGQVIGISGFSFSEANYALVASSADIAPTIEKLIKGESTSGLGQRRLPQGPGSTSFDIELRNLWDTREFVFEAKEGSAIEIEIEGEGDGKFSVSTPFEVILEVDEGESGVERATVDLSTGGVHFLQVGMASGEASRFHLASSVELKLLDDPDDGRTVAIGDTVAGSLDYFRDWDWYSISLKEGDTVRVSTDSFNVDTLMYVAFPGSGVNQAVSDDDSGGGLMRTNSEIVYRAPHTGEYFIVVTEAAGEDLGGYYLSVERAPEDAAVTDPSTPHPGLTPAELGSRLNSLYDCLLSSEEAWQSLQSNLEETFLEGGSTKEEARASAELMLGSREIMVSLLRQGIEDHADTSWIEEFTAEHCNEAQLPGDRPAQTRVPGHTGTIGQYVRGRTLHLNVVSLERIPELRYSTVEANDAARRWSLIPSGPGSELVLVRLKVENHTAGNSAIDIDQSAVELRDSSNATYAPMPIAETAWQDFRGEPEALITIDEGRCLNGSRALIDPGTAVRWRSEADVEQYVAFEDASITVGPDGRGELGPEASLSHNFSNVGNYRYVCGGSGHQEQPAEIQVMPSGQQDDVAARSILFLEGSFELEKGYGLDGYMVFEVPAGAKFRELHWEAGDSITVRIDAQPPTRRPTPTPVLGMDSSFGPLSGDLPHDPADNKVEVEHARVAMDDMVVQATFVNPYSAASNKWTYGFFLRDNWKTAGPGETRQYIRLLVGGDRRWQLQWRDRSNDKREEIATGTLSNFDTGDGGRNTLRVAVFGERGMFFVNDEFVAMLDMSKFTGVGDVAIVTGALKDDEVAGAVTRFEDFRGVSWMKGYGPARGVLESGPESSSEHRSGMWTRDLLAEATFTSPPGRSWDYGFSIRYHQENRLEVVVVDGDNRWSHMTHDAGDDGYTTVAEGVLGSSPLRENHLLLIALGDIGYFFVNGKLVARLDLSHNEDYGHVSAVGSIFRDHTGEPEFEDFNVWMPQ